MIKKPESGLLSKRIDQAIETKIIEMATRNKKDSKDFKLPSSVRMKAKASIKKNKILVISLGVNRNISAKFGELKDGLLILDDESYHCGGPDFVFLWKGKFPCMVVPEWDLNPIGTKDYYDAVADGRSTAPINTIIRAYESKEADQGKKLNSKVLIGIIIGGIVVAYILFAGGGK